MRYIQAICSIGLFGFLAYCAATQSFPGGEGGSSKTRALRSFVTSTTEQFGPVQAAAGFAAIGILLALFFVLRHREA